MNELTRTLCRWFAVATLALLLGGCAGLGGQTRTSGGGEAAAAQANEASCLRAGPRDPSRLWLQGSATGPLSAASSQTAYVNAIVRKIQEIVVTVSSKLVNVEKQTEDDYSVSVSLEQSVQTGPTEVRGARLEQSCATPSGKTVHALVSLPMTEWQRIVRLSRGGLLVVVGCSASSEGACGDATHQKAAAVVTEVGFSPKADVSAPKDAERESKDAVMRLAQEQDVAYVLWVRLRADADGDYMDGDYKVLQAVAQVTATLWDATDGKVLGKVSLGQPPGSRAQGRIRGMAYEDEGVATAIGNAVHKALQGDDYSDGLIHVLRRWHRGEFSR